MIELDTIMSIDLVTVGPDDSLETARRLMHDERIHHLPVVDREDRLVGLVSLTNVLAATDSFLRDEESKIPLDEIPIRDVMVTEVITVDEHAGIRQAALFLEKHKIGCLPVVTDGRLKGIITDTDFVGVLEQIEDIEPDEFEDLGED